MYILKVYSIHYTENNLKEISFRCRTLPCLMFSFSKFYFNLKMPKVVSKKGYLRISNCHILNEVPFYSLSFKFSRTLPYDSRLFLAIHWEKTQMLKRFPWDKTNGLKNAFFFLSQASTHHNFYFLLVILILAEAQDLSL